MRDTIPAYMNARSPKSRGNTITLGEPWLAMLNSMWASMKGDDGDHPRTLEALGSRLAELVGRDEAWSTASVSRFLAGEQVTDDMARAFSVLFGIPDPIVVADSMEEVRWFHAGKRFRRVRPVHFEKLLEAIEAAVEDVEAADRSERKLAALGSLIDEDDD